MTQGQKIWWLDHTPCEGNKKKTVRVGMKRKTRRLIGVCRKMMDQHSRNNTIKVKRRKLK